MTLREKLEEKVRNQIEDLDRLETGTEQCNMAIDGIIKLTNQISELDQIESEKPKGKSEKIEKVAKYGIELGKTTIPVIAAVTMGLISMKWEKVDTLTSTAGRNALRDVIKFKIF